MMLRRIIDTAFQLSITFCKKSIILANITKYYLCYNSMFFTSQKNIDYTT